MTITRRFALPVLTAGLLSGALLGLAGPANADTGLDGSYVVNSFVATPGDYASPAPNYVPWASAVQDGADTGNVYNDLVSTDAQPLTR